jgi:hypothetical protein
MSPEQPIQQASRRNALPGVMMSEIARLEQITAQLMAVQKLWNDPGREHHLADALASSRNAWDAIQAALAEGVLSLPADVQHNLLIVSVYADSKISACESIPSADALASLIALTHTLTGSLREWRVAA